MQIRLTVLAPRSGHAAARACDLLVTAPAGTALAAVASALATAVAGQDVPGPVVLYAGRERLDAQRCALGEPPLTDGAVLSLQVPGEDDAPAADDAPQLRVVAGPDAGGVHLLHGGQIRIGRSADADVPLDDPDVSRLHCVVTVAEDGRITVADLSSTNGTMLEGTEIGPEPVPLLPGALLRLGESSLLLTEGGQVPGLTTAPDGEGHLRVVRPDQDRYVPRRYDAGPGGVPDSGQDPARAAGAPVSGAGEHHTYPSGRSRPAPAGPPQEPPYDGARREVPPPHDRSATATHGAGIAFGPGVRGAGGVPGGVPPQGLGEGRTVRTYETGAAEPGTGPGRYAPHEQDPLDGPYGAPPVPRGLPRVPDPRTAAEGYGSPDSPTAHSRAAGPAAGEGPHGAADQDRAGEGPQAHTRTPGSRRQATPARGTELPDIPARRRGGIGAWARRLTGGRGEDLPDPGSGAPGSTGTGPGGTALTETWPDPSEVLLTALGPGPRLWERDGCHAEALVVRLGAADHELPDGAGPAAYAPVTVGLREAGSLGLAGPRERLTGLARSLVAQLAALHSPADLEIVLLSTDRGRGAGERSQEWGWLGWLPHARPAHGQDCRLLLAYDRDQAAARITELTRRMDEGPLGPGWPSAGRRAVAEAAARHDGPSTVVIVDGDPGSAALRESTARLAAAGSAGGIHLICLAETPAATLPPATATYELARSLSLPFRECGAVALLTGDVASAVQLLWTTGGQPDGPGTVAVVDAVSPAWADRFGRALAPLRAAARNDSRSLAAALPRSARLLDELGLARATPASLMARWASAADLGGDCTVVLGAGPRGAVSVDLTEEGPHLLIEGPPGSGRTELLRAVAASLAAAGRPDRLGLLLVDGAGGERGEGLAACTELPHVTEHLVASEPVRMREFARALGAELKRRAELLGRLGFTEWHSRQEVSDRMIGQRPPSGAELRAGRRGEPGPEQPRAGRPAPGSAPGGTLRTGTPDGEEPFPLPRLVVLVDDFDALVAPGLGSPGRPAAGSVVRALEAVARDGGRLGVHLVATSSCPDRTSDTDLAQGARLRVVLDAPPVAPAPEDPAPGRGRLGHPDGRVTPFQGGRVTGRIPRTATLRPTVLPLEWERMGDPPARRPVRELGNGPTDLALLASALERAARSVDAVPVAPLTPAHP